MKDVLKITAGVIIVLVGVLIIVANVVGITSLRTECREKGGYPTGERVTSIVCFAPDGAIIPLDSP